MEVRKSNRENRTAKNLCIIPARGGSKRIPRKNIKEFLGKPIIAYSIETAIKSGLFDEVMVSTDDQEIADVAKSYGALVPFMRSPENADDYAVTIDVVHEVLQEYAEQKISFENVCIIYPTAPFVSKERLEEGFNNLQKGLASLPVTEFSFPVWRSFKIEDNKLKYQWPEFEKSRSQDLEKLYHDAGQWYWIKCKELKETLIPRDTIPIVLNNIEVQDIDTPEDWKLAELKYEYLQSIK